MAFGIARDRVEGTLTGAHHPGLSFIRHTDSSLTPYSVKVSSSKSISELKLPLWANNGLAFPGWAFVCLRYNSKHMVFPLGSRGLAHHTATMGWNPPAAVCTSRCGPGGIRGDTSVVWVDAQSLEAHPMAVQAWI